MFERVFAKMIFATLIFAFVCLVALGANACEDAENEYPEDEIGICEVSDSAAQTIVSESLEKREQKIKQVRESLSCLDRNSYDRVYFVSSTDGNDLNDGLSEQTPWKTLKKTVSAKVAEGSLVLLKRGDIWRERFSLRKGVDYSSYGDPSLSMPAIYGSPEDGADPEKWSLLEGTDNIWVFYREIEDVGTLVFDHGEENSIKEIPDYYDGEYFVRGSNKTVAFDIVTQLECDLEHFNEYTAGQSSEYVPLLTKSKLYLRCDKGNPGDVFDSIEFNTRLNVVTNNADVHFDNISIKYGGAHGIGGLAANSNFTLSNCEIGWIGGVVQNYTKSTEGEFGTATRFGNGIEIRQNCDGFYVNNCYIYQCYDAGISHKGSGINISSGVPINAYMKNVYLCDNLLEYNFYNIEYSLSGIAAAGLYEEQGLAFPMMTNINYTDNLCFYAGYGFGKQRPDSDLMTHIMSGGENPSTEFHIENNLFFDSACYCSVTLANDAQWLPDYEGNTYVQKRGTYAAAHGNDISAREYFDDGVYSYIGDVLGDESARVVYLETVPRIIRAVTDERNGKLLVSGLDGYTVVSLDGGETFEATAEQIQMFELERLGESGVLAKALSRGNDSFASAVSPVEILPMFAASDNSENSGVVTAYNSPTIDATIFFPKWAKDVSEDFSFSYVPATAYISHEATGLYEFLESNGITVKLYGDTDMNGIVEFADFAALLAHFATQSIIADSYTADANADGEVSLADLSALLKMMR